MLFAACHISVTLNYNVKYMKQRIRSTTPFRLTKKDGENPTGKSLTVQGEALTIGEILEKWTYGINGIDLERDTIDGDENAEFDDIDLEKLTRADLATKFNIPREAAEKLNQAADLIRKARAAEEKKAKDAEAAELKELRTKSQEKKGYKEE